MSNETKTLNKQEAQAPQGTEWTRSRPVFMPRVDIYETSGEIVILADMPGVDDKHVDITLEKNVLTIHGKVEPTAIEGHTLAYEEYVEGDYQRAFSLSDEVDQNGISAAVKNGVLKLTLPKAAPAKARKIDVKAE